MKFFLLAITLWVLFNTHCFAHNPLPKDLKKIAKSIGCIPADKGYPRFDDARLFVGRSFTYLNEKGDAIFVCTGKKEKRNIYLVFTENGKVITKKQHAGGRSAYTITKINSVYASAINLTNFYVYHPRKHGEWTPGPNIEVYPTVFVYGEGTYSIFIKYKNTWYFCSYD